MVFKTLPSDDATPAKQNKRRKEGVDVKNHLGCSSKSSTCPQKTSIPRGSVCEELSYRQTKSQSRTFPLYTRMFLSQRYSSLYVHDAFGTSNMHRLLYFCSSWFLVRTCSRSVASCCCCSDGLLSIPGILVICSRASWIFAFSLANSWWTSWLSLSMLRDNEVNDIRVSVSTLRWVHAQL